MTYRASELSLPTQEHHNGRRYCVLDFETLGQHSGVGTIQLVVSWPGAAGCSLSHGESAGTLLSHMGLMKDCGNAGHAALLAKECSISREDTCRCLVSAYNDKIKMQEFRKVSSAQWPTCKDLPASIMPDMQLRMVHI